MSDSHQPSPNSPADSLDGSKSSQSLTHLDAEGRASMVDVSQKDSTTRQATASATVTMNPETLKVLKEGSGKKGEALQVARLAGIMAAKKTDDLIPLCHGLSLSSVKVEFLFVGETSVQVLATTRCVGQTGVEMEAMVAASIASLTIYDMCKGIDRGIVVSNVRLEEKIGGKSGHWIRSQSEE